MSSITRVAGTPANYEHIPAQPLAKRPNKYYRTIVLQRDFREQCIRIVGVKSSDGKITLKRDIAATNFLPPYDTIRAGDPLAPNKRRGIKKREDRWFRFNTRLGHIELEIVWLPDIHRLRTDRPSFLHVDSDWESPLTSYGMACGYIEQTEYNDANRITLERDPGTDVYHVKGFIAGQHIWDTDMGLTKGRMLYRRYVKMMQIHLAIQCAIQLGTASKAARGRL